MELSYSDAEEAFRAEARAWLRAHVPRELPPSGSKDGFAAHVAWERELHAAGWSVVAWPRAFGGRDASIIEWLIFEEEYYLAGAPPRVTQNGIFLLAPSLFEYGTPEQQQRILPAMAAADVLWAQGWSEPGAGSDLAAVTSTAVRVNGGWRLHGQKTWSTRASFCHAMHGLFRTDPSAPRHKGLTYFLVPLDAPGVRVNGFRRLDGDEDFAEIFFDDVFVADHDVVGPVNQGWKVAMSTTGSERGLTLRSPGRFLASAGRLVELYRRVRAPSGSRTSFPVALSQGERKRARRRRAVRRRSRAAPWRSALRHGAFGADSGPPGKVSASDHLKTCDQSRGAPFDTAPSGPAPGERNQDSLQPDAGPAPGERNQDSPPRDVVDPLLRDAVIRAWMDARAYQLFTLQSVTRLAAGTAIGADSSIAKLAWSELDLRLHEAALGLLGPLAELAPDAPDAVEGGAWQKGFQFALAGPIYAGTNEIQKNVVAERLLGLPKE